MKRIASLLWAVAFGAIVLIVALRGTDTSNRDNPRSMRADMTQHVSADAPEQSSSDPVRHDVSVRHPDGPPLIELSQVDPLGRSGSVACSTCHSVRKPNRANRTADSLDEFHQGLKVVHGTLACYSCHNPDSSDSLRLADGTSVAYRDVMTLCSQCHAAQATAYQHGAHGGMNGYWDLSRGPQTKNNCVDCHDPHVPSYPKMIVGFKPRDRFLQRESDHDDRR